MLAIELGVHLSQSVSQWHAECEEVEKSSLRMITLDKVYQSILE